MMARLELIVERVLSPESCRAGLGVARYSLSMTTLALNEMTLREKLAAMEALWEDLSRTPGVVESPAWHKEVLEQRQNRVAEGKAGYTAGDSAKVDLLTD